MIARDIYPLAWTLWTQAPDLCIRDTVGDPLMQNAVADRCMATCQQAGLADEDARGVGEALAGYLYGWCGRDVDLEARVEHAQAALNLGAGGDGDHILPQRPTGTMLPVVAIVRMVAGAWAWTSRHDDRRHAVRQSCRYGRTLMAAARQKETSHG